jgi:hypothetical protein
MASDARNPLLPLLVIALKPATQKPTRVGHVLIRDQLLGEYRIGYFDPESTDPGWFWLGRSDRVETVSWAELPAIHEPHANKHCWECGKTGHGASTCPNVKPEMREYYAMTRAQVGAPEYQEDESAQPPPSPTEQS